jgi:hypothetical protein
MVAAQADAIPRPDDDLLWIDEDVYNWRCLDEFAVCSYWTGHYAACAAACQQLLDCGLLPEDQRARVSDNLRFATDRMRGPMLPHQPDRSSLSAASQSSEVSD